MVANRKSDPILVGLVADDEPIRLEGLSSIFTQSPMDGHVGLAPVTGTLPELLAMATLEHLVIDLHSSSGGLDVLASIRRARPDIRLIVIGPAGDDEIVLNTIVGGARAYLDLNAGPEMVRRAIEVVTEGSIWAPRQLLSKLIDRLLRNPDSSLTSASPQLTVRERQVLELIMMAHSNREIANQLGIEERTVKAHVGRLMRKAGADNRIKLSMSALSLSLLPKDAEKRQRGDKPGSVTKA